MIRAQFIGAPELVATLQRLQDNLAALYIDNALQAGAQVVDASVTARAPSGSGRDKHPGNLRANIQLSTLSVSRDKVVKILSIGGDAFYWRFLEFGTHWRKELKRKAQPLSPGDYKMRPHPFVIAAFKGSKNLASNVIRDTFREQILGFKS